LIEHRAQRQDRNLKIIWSVRMQTHHDQLDESILTGAVLGKFHNASST
jgi:hypothetical protein